MDCHLSVIVPVYNAEKTLRRCVDSLRPQMREGDELILVNDGSKDGSAALCAQYAAQDARISYVSKENGGVSSARNAGLDEVREIAVRVGAKHRLVVRSLKLFHKRRIAVNLAARHWPAGRRASAVRKIVGKKPHEHHGDHGQQGQRKTALAKRQQLVGKARREIDANRLYPTGPELFIGRLLAGRTDDIRVANIILRLVCVDEFHFFSGSIVMGFVGTECISSQIAFWTSFVGWGAQPSRTAVL